eukprot:g44173.t1
MTYTLPGQPYMRNADYSQDNKGQDKTFIKKEKVDEASVLFESNVKLKQVMSTEEFETYSTYVTSPGLQIPLLLEFFAAGRDAYLMNLDLQRQLMSALFQPGDFAREEVIPVEIPVPDNRRKAELGTKYGQLIQEIMYAPIAVADPLSQMLRAIIDRATGEYRKQLADLTLWITRVVVRVLEYFRVASKLEAECPQPVELLHTMRSLLQSRVKPMILDWLNHLNQDQTKNEGSRHEIEATLAIISQAVPQLDLSKSPEMITEMMRRASKVLAQHALSYQSENNPVIDVVAGYERLRTIVVEWAQDLELSDKKQLDKALSQLVMSVADADDKVVEEEWLPFSEPTKCRGWLFESTHPYLRAKDMYEEVWFPGVSSIEIIFHHRTTLNNTDYITIYKDRSLTEFWREKMTLNSWPGPSGPPLTIPTDHFVFHFHSERAGTETGWGFMRAGTETGWGFMVYATAPVSPECIKQLTKETGSKVAEVKAALSYYRNDMDKARAWLTSEPDKRAKGVRFGKAGGMLSDRNDAGPSGFYSNKSASVRINLQTSEVYRNNQRQIPVSWQTSNHPFYKECMPAAKFCVPTEYTLNREVIRVVDKTTIYEVQTWNPLVFDEFATEEILTAEQKEIDDMLAKEGKNNEEASIEDRVEAVNMGGTTELGILNFPVKAGYNRVRFRDSIYTRYEEGSLGWVSQKLDLVFEECFSSYKVSPKEYQRIVKIYSREGNAETIERITTAMEQGSGVPAVAAHLLMYHGDPGKFNTRIAGNWKEIIAYSDLRTIEVYSLQENGRRAFRELEFSTELNDSLFSLEPVSYRRDPRVLAFARNAAGVLNKQTFNDRISTQSVVIRRARNVHTPFKLADRELEEDAIETYVGSVMLRGALPEALLENYLFWQTGPLVLRGYLKEAPAFVNGEPTEVTQDRQKLKKLQNTHILVHVRRILHFWRPPAISEKFGQILTIEVKQGELAESAQARVEAQLRDEARRQGVELKEEDIKLSISQDYAGRSLKAGTPLLNLASWNGLILRLTCDAQHTKVIKEQILLNPFNFGGARGDGLKVISKVFRAAEGLGQVLIWSNSKPLGEGDECSINKVELPRLQLTFSTARGSHNEVRLSSDDFDGKFVNLSPSAATRSLARIMPHTIFLADSIGESYLMVPNYELRRVLVETCPLSTDLAFSKPSTWLRSVKAPTYVYTVHRSAAFLLAPSLSASLYLVSLALYAGEYEQCSRIVTDCQNDTTFSMEQAYMSKMAANTFSVDRHPDACACRVRLALVIFESGETPAWDWEADVDSYIRYIDRVSWECRLTQLELDQIQSKVTKNLKEAQKKLEEKRKADEEERLASGKEETEEEKKKREESEKIHEISFELVAEAKPVKEAGGEWFEFVKKLPEELEKYTDKDEWKNGYLSFRTPSYVKEDFQSVGLDTADLMDSLSRDYPTGQSQKLGFVLLHMILLGQFKIRWYCFTAEEEQQRVKEEREKYDKLITEYNRLLAAGKEPEEVMEEKEDMINCSFCGTPNSYSADICPNCGRQLVFQLNEGSERKRILTGSPMVNMVQLMTMKYFFNFGVGRDQTTMAIMRLPMAILTLMSEAKAAKPEFLEAFPSFPYAKNKIKLSSLFFFNKGQVVEFFSKTVEEAVKYSKSKSFQKVLTDLGKIPKPQAATTSKDKETFKPPSRPVLEDVSCGQFKLTIVDWGTREADQVLKVSATTLNALASKPLQDLGEGKELSWHLVEKKKKESKPLPFDPEDPPTSLSGPHAKREWKEMLGRIQAKMPDAHPGYKLKYFPTGPYPQDDSGVVKAALDPQALPRLIDSLLSFQQEEERWIEKSSERLELIANVREVKEGKNAPASQGKGTETGNPPELRVPNLARAILADSKQRLAHLKLLNPTIEDNMWDNILITTALLMLRTVRLAQVNRCLNLATTMRKLLQEFALRKLFDLLDGEANLEARTTPHMLKKTLADTYFDPVAALASLRKLVDTLDSLKTLAREQGLQDPEQTAAMVFQYYNFDGAKAKEKLSNPAQKSRLAQNLLLARRGCFYCGEPLYNSQSSNSTRPAQSTAAMWHVLQSTASALASFLSTRTHYFSPQGEEGTVLEAKEFSCDPRFLVFEFMIGYTLRQRQVELVQAFIKAHREENRSSVRQMIMGAGKTTVIAPLLGLILADGESLITQVVPPALLDMSRSVLRNAFTSILSKSVLTLNFSRDSGSVDIQETFQKLYDKLTRARRQRSIVLATPATLKAMMLKYVDLLNNEHSASPALFVPFKQLKMSKDEAMGLGNMVAKSGLAADELAKVLKLFGEEEKGIALVDEVDMILHPLKSELNFPIGPMEPLPMAGARMRLAVHLMEALFYGQQKRVSLPYFKAMYTPILEAISKQMNEGEEKLFIRKEPHTVLLQEVFYEEMLRPLLAEWAWVWLCQQDEYEAQVRHLTGTTDIPMEPKQRKYVYPIRTTADEVRRVVVKYIAALTTPQERATLAEWFTLARARPAPANASDGKETKDEFAKELKNDIENEKLAMQQINLCKEWVISFFPHCISKVVRVAYGLLQDSHAYNWYLEKLGPSTPPKFQLESMDNAQRDELWGAVAERRRLVAVPYVGKDVPSQTSEFAHPEVMTGLTILAYRYEGLRPNDILYLVQELRKSLNYEGGSYSERKSYILFEEWMQRGRAHRARQAGQDVATFQDELHVLPLHIFNPLDNEQLYQLTQAIQFTPEVINYYLQSHALAKTLTYQRVKLSASGMDLGGDILFGRRLGFSGTPSNLLPHSLYPCEFEPGSEAEIIGLLSNPGLVGYSLVDSDWTVDSFLKTVATSEHKFYSLIDTAALITGKTNIEVAQQLLEYGLQHVDACVFLDNADHKLVVDRTGKVVPLALSGLSPSRYFVFFDQVHTTGMDIKMPIDALAAVTVGKGMTLRDHAQGCYRMRGFGKGQTLHVFLMPEVKKLVQVERPALRDAKIAAHQWCPWKPAGEGKTASQRNPLEDVMAWLLANSFVSERVQKQALRDQQLSNAWRAKAYKDLLASTAPGMAKERDQPLFSRFRDRPIDASKLQAADMAELDKRGQELARKLGVPWSKRNDQDLISQLQELATMAQTHAMMRHQRGRRSSIQKNQIKLVAGFNCRNCWFQNAEEKYACVQCGTKREVDKTVAQLESRQYAINVYLHIVSSVDRDTVLRNTTPETVIVNPDLTVNNLRDLIMQQFQLNTEVFQLETENRHVIPPSTKPLRDIPHMRRQAAATAQPPLFITCPDVTVDNFFEQEVHLPHEVVVSDLKALGVSFANELASAVATLTNVARRLNKLNTDPAGQVKESKYEIHATPPSEPSSPTSSTRSLSVSTMSNSSVASNESDEPLFDPNDPVYFPTSAVTPATWLSQCLKVFRERISWDLPDVVPQDLPFRAQLFGKAAKRKAFVDTEKPKLMVYRVLMDVPPTVNPVDPATQAKQKTEAAAGEPPPPPRFDSEMVQEQEKEVEAEVATQNKLEDLDKFLKLRQEAPWRFTSIVTAPPNTLIPQTFHPMRTFYMSKETKANLNYPYHVLFSENHAPVLHQNTVKRRRLRNVLVVLEWHVAPLYRNEGREYQLWSQLKEVDREVYAPAAYDPEAKWALTEQYNKDGQFVVAVSLAEAESLRRAIQVMYRQANKGELNIGGQLRPMAELPKLRLHGADLGVRLTPVLSVDDSAQRPMFRPASWRPSPFDTGLQALRFFNGAIKFTEEELVAVLTAFQGLSKGDKEAHFKAVMEGRRRESSDTSTTGLGKIFDSDNPATLLAIRENIAKVQHALQKSGRELRAIFQEFDQDNSDWLDNDEMVKLIRKYVPDMDEVKMQDMLKHCDEDGSSTLTWREFQSRFGVGGEDSGVEERRVLISRKKQEIKVGKELTITEAEDALNAAKTGIIVEEKKKTVEKKKKEDLDIIGNIQVLAGGLEQLDEMVWPSVHDVDRPDAGGCTFTLNGTALSAGRWMYEVVLVSLPQNPSVFGWCLHDKGLDASPCLRAANSDGRSWGFQVSAREQPPDIFVPGTVLSLELSFSNAEEDKGESKAKPGEPASAVARLWLDGNKQAEFNIEVGAGSELKLKPLVTLGHGFKGRLNLGVSPMQFRVLNGNKAKLVLHWGWEKLQKREAATTSKDLLGSFINQSTVGDAKKIVSDDMKLLQLDKNAMKFTANGVLLTHGKWYWELAFLKSALNCDVLMGFEDRNPGNPYLWYYKLNKSSTYSSQPGMASKSEADIEFRVAREGDVFGCALDLYKGTIDFSINGVWNKAPFFSDVNPRVQGLLPSIQAGFCIVQANLGGRPFRYAPPDPSYKRIQTHVEAMKGLKTARPTTKAPALSRTKSEIKTVAGSNEPIQVLSGRRHVSADKELVLQHLATRRYPSLTFPQALVTSGRWYFEVKLVTVKEGMSNLRGMFAWMMPMMNVEPVQCAVGWAVTSFYGSSYEMKGVGDDDLSAGLVFKGGFMGKTTLRHAGKALAELDELSEDDMLGCALDCEAGEGGLITYSVNGDLVGTIPLPASFRGKGLMPVLSCTSKIVLQSNLGQKKFWFPPHTQEALSSRGDYQSLYQMLHPEEARMENSKPMRLLSLLQEVSKVAESLNPTDPMTPMLLEMVRSNQRLIDSAVALQKSLRK